MNKPISEELPQLDPDEYRDFSRILKTMCGIDLGENKQYLVATRIRRILIDHKLESLRSLTRAIQIDSERNLRQKVIDAMTTNETFWFRDTYPYEYLDKTLLPQFAQANPGRKIKIWSAACSTGQEPYSISMVVDERARAKFGNISCEAEILATDLSSSALDIAKKGSYDRLSVVRGLSDQRMREYFTKVNDDIWQVCPSIANRIRFRALNLQDSFYLLGRFDVVFCRNVLIYFSAELKRDILTKLHATLNPGGILFLGSSESITGLNDLYEMVNCQPGVAYRVKDPKRL